MHVTGSGPALSTAARSPAVPSSGQENYSVPALLYRGSSQFEVEKKTDHVPFSNGHGWESNSGRRTMGMAGRQVLREKKNGLENAELNRDCWLEEGTSKD